MRLVLDARSASFGALIDDASLLRDPAPSADDAVGRYEAARASRARWTVGRFTCPTSMLMDLAAALTRSFRPGHEPWEVVAVFDGEPGPSASAAQAFHNEMQPAATIAAATARSTTANRDDVGGTIDAIASIQPEIVPFLDLDTALPLDDQMAVVASELSRRSRVGGVQISFETPDTGAGIPVNDVASFLTGTVARRLPFRVSGGIDRPIAGNGDMRRHGFVNALVAAVAAGRGDGFDTVSSIVAETDPGAFSLGAAFVSWNGVSIPGPTVRRVRTDGFVAFGSSDPGSAIDALQRLGFVGEGS